MLQSIYSQVGLAVYLLVCLLAWIGGGRTEKRAALIVLIGSCLTIIVQTRDFTNADTAVMIVDAAQGLAFLVLAVVSVRVWVVVATALQLLMVTVHAAMMFDTNIQAFTYLSVLALLGYAMLASMLIGTWQSWGERARR